MNNLRFLDHPGRYQCNHSGFENIHESYNNDNDGDSLWDDDIGENSIEVSLTRKEAPVSSSSSLSSSNVDYWESSVYNCKHYRDRKYYLEDDDGDCKTDDSCDENSLDENDSHDSYSRASSSSSSNPSLDSSDSIDASQESVVRKIEDFITQTVVEPLIEEPDPSSPEIDVEIDAIGFKRKLAFHNQVQARSLTSIILVASFCYDLLASPDTYDGGEEEDTVNSPHGRRRRIRKTTTTREVYYFYVTYFRDQRECDKAIWDLVQILNLPSRQSLGLVASPRGWFCGSIDVYNAYTNELKFNGRELDAHGMAITPSTYDNPHHNNHCNESTSVDGTRVDLLRANEIRIESDAQFILVIEKEGIYTRLSEDKFFLRIPCILVTGKGFPDIATRRWVRRMQKTLKIPVYGLCDCNPFGVLVLDTYRHHQGVKLSVDKKIIRSRKKKNRNGRVDADEDDPLEIHWIGLRPSQIEKMSLPPEVFQELTNNDMKRLDSLFLSKSAHCKPFAERGRNRAQRRRELRSMRKYKVELEALHWKGADYLSQFVYDTIKEHASQERPKHKSHPKPYHALNDVIDSEEDSDDSDHPVPERAKSS